MGSADTAIFDDNIRTYYNLQVDGNAVIQHDAQVYGNLVVYGTFSFPGLTSLNIPGRMAVQGLDVSGDINAGSVLASAISTDSLNASSITSTSVSATTGNISGNLNVGGNATIQGTLSPKGSLKHEGSQLGFFGTTPVPKQAVLPVANNAAINTVSILTDGPAVVTNTRDRVAAIEARLKAYGLLP